MNREFICTVNVIHIVWMCFLKNLTIEYSAYLKCIGLLEKLHKSQDSISTLSQKSVKSTRIR